MWAWILNSVDDLKQITQAAQGLYARPEETPTGGWVARVERVESPSPHLLLLTGKEGSAEIRNRLLWLQHELQPQFWVSGGSSWDGTPGSDRARYLVPTLCLRSAGRSELGAAPVIYEELRPDLALQQRLRDSLGPENCDEHHALFACDRDVERAEEQAWLALHLNCRSGDAYTADMLLLGHRLGVRVGLFKRLENASGSILDAWRSLSRGFFRG